MFFQSGSANACFQTVVSLWQCINWRNKDEKEKFMARAIELSEEGAAKGCGGPFGSVVVKEGKIVG